MSGDHPAQALHPTQSSLTAFAGPTTGAERATVRAAVLPFACWRADGFNFEFDSSIVRPELAAPLAALAALVEEHTQDGRRPPLSVFGHADPLGDDDYNKTLSGRRAQAVYALLTRRVDLWEALHAASHGGDSWQEKKAVRLMLGHLGYGDDLGERKRFQRDHALKEDGDIGPRSREALFAAYMDALAPALKVDPADFLGGGADPEGKADYQGCGELNPTRVLSDAEEGALKHDPAARREAHAVNRRVMVFVFRPGTRVDPQSWACPRAKEGVAACRKRLWSDGEARRAPGAARRTFGETRDTFACRFYHRLSDRSPCEGVLPAVRVRLYDREGAFVAHAPYVLAFGGERRAGVADARGVVVARFSELPRSVFVSWGPSEGPSQAPPPEDADLPLEAEVFTAVDRDDEVSDTAALARLRNLGYFLDPTPAGNVRDFQLDFRAEFGLEVDGLLAPATKRALRVVHNRCADRLHQPQVVAPGGPP